MTHGLALETDENTAELAAKAHYQKLEDLRRRYADGKLDEALARWIPPAPDLRDARSRLRRDDRRRRALHAGHRPVDGRPGRLRATRASGSSSSCKYRELEQAFWLRSRRRS
jgi:hypothetical protein